MLRLHTAKSSAAVKQYFELSDYLASDQAQETVGHWVGKFAEAMGLIGTVTKEAFDRLCDNLHPITGEQLTLRNNDERRIGTDNVFSGVKSFSIIEALADAEERQRLYQAFDAAINETVADDIEPDMKTRTRKGGQDSDRVTGNLVAAGYDHLTARPVDENTPPDMHRHRHLFVFNATHDAEEMAAKATQLGDIFRDRPYYQAVFYARLTEKLKALGYGIDKREGGSWEVAGVPQSMIDTFSKRTDEVEAEAERLGIDDPSRKAELGGKTRNKKQKDLTYGELREAWFAQLDDAEREALATVYASAKVNREQAADRDKVTPAAAVAYALAHCSEQLSVTPEREIKRVALLYGLGDVRPKDIDREMQEPCHGLMQADIDGRRMATTHALQAEEDGIIGFAARGIGAVAPVGVAEGLDRLRSDGKPLNDGQWQAVTGLLGSENRVNIVQGPAGAGKTDMLSKYRDGMGLAGKSVMFLASSADAVSVLHKDGFADARTVAHFLLDEKMQRAAAGGTLVIDETSMLGHKDAVRLFAVAKERDVRLVFVGDPMQHGSVPRGALMRILTDYAGVKPFRLTRIMRQRDERYLDAAKLLSQGLTGEGFDALDAMDWVKEREDAGERYRELAAEYVQARQDKETVLVVSPTHREAAAITAAIRDGLREAKLIGAEDQPYTHLVPVQLSEAERGLTRNYRKGDILQFHQNAKGGFVKGDRFTVTDPATVPVELASKFSVYRPHSIGLAVGDDIRFTSKVWTVDRKHKLDNGTHRTIAEIRPDGSLRLDNGWVVSKDAGHFRHGVVETSFGSQGKTVQRVILGMAAGSAGAMNQEQMYVSATRGKLRLSLYTDDKDAVKRAIPRSSQKLAAVDLRPKTPEPFRQLKERERRQAANAGLRQKKPPVPLMIQLKDRLRRQAAAAIQRIGQPVGMRLNRLHDRLRRHACGRLPAFVPVAARTPSTPTHAQRAEARRNERSQHHGR